MQETRNTGGVFGVYHAWSSADSAYRLFKRIEIPFLEATIEIRQMDFWFVVVLHLVKLKFVYENSRIQDIEC